MEVRISPTRVLFAIWVAWGLSWWIAAAWRDRTVKRAGSSREVPYSIVAGMGALLLFAFYRHRRVVLWRVDQSAAWCLVGLVAVGLCFTWWARLHLGRLWSRWIVRKEHHHLVQTGPYALVRHPIYTGVSFSLIAMAALLGTLSACLGVALIILSFYMKARLEERFLREQLGVEAYDSYARRVPMLIPFSRHG